jgi:hypothetical protein
MLFIEKRPAKDVIDKKGKPMYAKNRITRVSAFSGSPTAGGGTAGLIKQNKLCHFGTVSYEQDVFI